jgi:hypothetical protein
MMGSRSTTAASILALLLVGGPLQAALGATDAGAGPDPAATAPVVEVPGRWQEVARAPFGSTTAVLLPTDGRTVVLERGRQHVAAYDATADAWTRVPALPEPYAYDRFGGAIWTGDTIVIPRMTLAAGQRVLDALTLEAGADGWTATSGTDIPGDVAVDDTTEYGIAATAWDGARVIVITVDNQVASFDPVSGSWNDLPVIEHEGRAWHVYTGVMEPIAELRDDEGISLLMLDPAAGTWAEAPESPLDPHAAPGGAVWDGDRLAFVTFHPGGMDRGVSSAWYDPRTREWTTFDHGCTGTNLANDGVLQAGPYLVDGSARRMLELQSGDCFRLPPRKPRLTGGLAFSDGDDLVYWSGVSSESSTPSKRTFRLSGLDRR